LAQFFFISYAIPGKSIISIEASKFGIKKSLNMSNNEPRQDEDELGIQK